MARRKHTKESLLECLRVYYTKHGEVPLSIAWKLYKDMPNARVYRYHFGSWSEAINLAGLPSYDKRNRERAEKVCKHCQKIFYRVGKGIFCSGSCAAKYNNKHRSRSTNVKVCLHCGVELKGRARYNIYCSNKCSAAHRSEAAAENMFSKGDIADKYYHSVPLTIRKYLLRKYGNKCGRCGWDRVNPISGKVPLEIEHIDGNSQNNKEENLIPLCPNCHSLTPSYKGLNRGKGRKSLKTALETIKIADPSMS